VGPDESTEIISTFKRLLSIPCDGRGARRPLGQSSRESVGPAALYQVSAANRRAILIQRAFEHATRCLPRHVLGFRRCSKEAMGEAEESGEVGS